MCFSAEASFMAGTFLVSLGGFCANFAYKQQKNYFLFSLLPFFFGVQQLIEGVVWLCLSSNSTHLANLFGYVYLFFAFFFWPIYVPLSLYFIENIFHRKRVLLFVCAGIVVGFILYIPILLKEVSFTVSMVKHSIYYDVHRSDLVTCIYSILYILIITFAFICSSHEKIKIFGVLVLLSSVVSYWGHLYAFTSVWCFFAAILSSYILYVLFSLQKRIELEPF